MYKVQPKYLHKKKIKDITVEWKKIHDKTTHTFNSTAK